MISKIWISNLKILSLVADTACRHADHREKQTDQNIRKCHWIAGNQGINLEVQIRAQVPQKSKPGKHAAHHAEQERSDHQHDGGG